MNIGNRVKLIRTLMKLNQAEFGDKIGIKAAGISKIENGERNPSEPVIRIICREFSINHEWLIDGQGEMKQDIEVSDSARFAHLMYGENENKKQLFRIIADMPDELLDKMIDYLQGKLK